MKGLKRMISQGASEVDAGSLVKQMWERVCKVGAIHEILQSKDNLILKVFSDCLWMIKYTPIPFDVCTYKLLHTLLLTHNIMHLYMHI